jgi:hypothetical protein
MIVNIQLPVNKFGSSFIMLGSIYKIFLKSRSGFRNRSGPMIHFDMVIKSQILLNNFVVTICKYCTFNAIEGELNKKNLYFL